MQFLGFDTSNYTTSAALYDVETDTMYTSRRLLPVREGQLGLRQSNAVFHHTAALPQIVGDLPQMHDVAAVGASARPRDAEGSYMPCFLTGLAAASCTAKALGVPLRTFSHQAGHIAAALYSAGRTDLFAQTFLAFHVSGGTTDLVRVRPDDTTVIAVEPVLSSLDLKAGQAIDRVGVMLGFPFPAGRYVDEASRESSRTFAVRVPMRDGQCSLSGLQNQCEKLFNDGESAADICRYCLTYIARALTEMARYALERNGDLPLVFSGGVMANTLLRETLGKTFDCVFASPAYAGDNAAGIAYLTYLCSRGN